jgi:PAS domain S-box-containing protein
MSDRAGEARVIADAPPIDPLLDEAPCGFLSFDDDGHLVIINATLLATLGYTREELAARHIEAILTVGSRIFYQTHFFPLLRLHGRVDEIFLLLRTKHGEDVAALVNAVRRERGGRPVTDVVLLRLQERRKFEDALLAAKRTAEQALAVADAHRQEVERANELLERQAVELELSQQQLLEQAAELQEQRAIAEEANRAKSAFLTTMSHELRTPLNAIGGYAQLLEMAVHGPVSDEQKGVLDRIVRSQQHVLRLINDLLNLARVESGRVEYELRVLNVAEIVRTTLPMIEPQLAGRGLTYQVAVPADLTMYADRDKVEQVLLNLLSNAAKFTPSGGHVRVEARVASDRADRVQLRVSDTGVGIPVDRLEEIFEPFVQVGADQATRSEGSGLGLAISRELARGMGGDLSAESEPGVGSTFTLVLPGA